MAMLQQKPEQLVLELHHSTACKAEELTATIATIVRFKSPDLWFQKTVRPASIPHKICVHFVHKIFEIGHLLSNRLEIYMRKIA